MAYALDITVLEQGDAARIGNVGDGANAPPLDHLASMLDWLVAFHQDRTLKFAMDSGYLLWREYARLGDDNYVIRLLTDKLNRQEVDVRAPAYHGRDGVTVPAPFTQRSLTWRLVLAVTLADRHDTTVVNATDPHWVRHETDLAAESVSVVHLLEDWLRGYVEHLDTPPPQPGDLRYYVPPRQLSGRLADADSVGRGINSRMAWEKEGRRYEFDSRHNTVEVYRLSDRTWLHEAELDGTVTKTTGGEGRRCGKP